MIGRMLGRAHNPERIEQIARGDDKMKIRVPVVVVAAILAMAMPQNAKCG